MICIDTNILFWGLVRAPAPIGSECLNELAEQFFAHVTSEKIPTIVPSQVLAEFLVRNTNNERQEALALIEESFPIAPLDFQASMIAAELSSNRQHTDEVRAMFGLKRVCYKADLNIIASAIAFGATTIVTGNWKEIRALAQQRIVVKSLEEYMQQVQPPPPVARQDKGSQSTLFPSVE